MLLNIVLNAVFHLHLKRLSITAYYFKWYVFFFFFCLILKIILVTIEKSVKKVKISQSLTAQCRLGETAEGCPQASGRIWFYLGSTF